MVSLIHRSIDYARRISRFLKEALSGTDQDFTRGPIDRGILLLALPMMLELVMESVFAVVDIFFVAQLGADAIAVVGLTEAVITVLYAVAIGLSMGVTAIIARRIGEHNPTAASLVAGQAIWLGLAFSVVISFSGFWFAADILAAMGANQTILDNYISYPQILFGGSSTILFIFLLNGVFRGAGDAALALRVLWISNAINIVLDPCLIFGWWIFPEMGVAGAAVATTIGRGVGVLLQLYYLFNVGHRITVHREQLAINLPVSLDILKVSRGGMLQFFIATSSWILLMKIVSAFGSNAIAGYTVAIRILDFSILPAWGLSNSAATLVGQNLGAKQPERAEKCVWRVAQYNFVFLTLVGLTFIFIPEVLMRLFTQDLAIVAYGASCLRWLGFGFGLFAIGLVITQAFNGAGDTTTPSWINFWSFWVIQIPLAYALALTFDMGPSGVFASILFSETLMTLIALKWFRRGAWKSFSV